MASSSPPLPDAAPEQVPVPAVPPEPVPAPGAGLPVLGAGAVAAVVFAHLATDLFAGYSAPLQRHFWEIWRLSRLETALLALPGSLMIMLQPLLGLSADRMRTRAFVMGGLLMSALGYGTALPLAALFGRSAGYWLALAGIWMGATGVAAYHPQGAALSGRAGSGRAVAFFVFGGTVGYASGLLMPPLFVKLGMLPWITCLTGLAGVALICQVFVPRLRPRHEPLRPPAIAEVLGRLVSDIRPVFGPLFVFWLMVVLRAVTLSSFTQFTSIYCKEVLGLSQLSGAALVAGFFMAQALAVVIVPRVAEKLGERTTLAISFLGGGALLSLSVAASRAGSTAGSYALLVLGGAVLGGTVPINVAAGQRLLKRSAALGSGIMIGFGWGTGGLLVPLVGWLGDVFDNTGVTLLAAAALTVPGALLALFLPGKPRPAG